MDGDEFKQSLDQWSAQARIEDARTERARERWHTQLTSETSTLAGLLNDLHESGLEVRVATLSGREHVGHITRLGADFVSIESLGRPITLIPVGLIASLQMNVSPKHLGGVGNRTLPATPAFAEALTELAANRSKVWVVAVGNDSVRSGELLAAGDGIVTLALDTPPNQTLIVTIDQISEVTVPRTDPPTLLQ